MNILQGALALSVALNAVLAALLFRHKIKKKEMTYDAQQLLRDLTLGDALIRITRIAPENVLLRSPRDVAL